MSALQLKASISTEWTPARSKRDEGGNSATREGAPAWRDPWLMRAVCGRLGEEMPPSACHVRREVFDLAQVL